MFHFCTPFNPMFNFCTPLKLQKTLVIYLNRLLPIKLLDSAWNGLKVYKNYSVALKLRFGKLIVLVIFGWLGNYCLFCFHDVF